MLTLLYILTTLTAPSPAMTIDELADYQNHAEAALRLQAGEVTPARLRLAAPDWAFETPRTPVELDAELASVARISPFEADESVGPFAEAR